MPRTLNTGELQADLPDYSVFKVAVRTAILALELSERPLDNQDLAIARSLARRTRAELDQKVDLRNELLAEKRAIGALAVFKAPVAFMHGLDEEDMQLRGAGFIFGTRVSLSIEGVLAGLQIVDSSKAPGSRREDEEGIQAYVPERLVVCARFNSQEPSGLTNLVPLDVIETLPA